MSKEEKIVKGTPTPLLLPASQFKWSHAVGPITIDVPINSTLARTVGESTKVSSVTFDYSEDVDVWMDLGVVTKLMFSTGVYPKLEQGQVFAVRSILVDKGKNILTVVGNVLDRIYQ